jgi:hypothetical protein
MLPSSSSFLRLRFSFSSISSKLFSLARFYRPSDRYMSSGESKLFTCAASAWL